MSALGGSFSATGTTMPEPRISIPSRELAMPPSRNIPVHVFRGAAASGARPMRAVPDALSELQWACIIDALGLSQREAEILRCAFYNERDTSIANSLGISSHTVHTHRVRLFRKLGVG